MTPHVGINREFEYFDEESAIQSNSIWIDTLRIIIHHQVQGILNIAQLVIAEFLWTDFYWPSGTELKIKRAFFTGAIVNQE